MNSNNNSFSEDLERLIRLFKRIKENLINDTSHNIDKTFIQNIDLMISNYETIKGNMPPEMLNMMGEPIHKLMTLLLEQLSTEYKDIIGKSEPVSEPQKSIQMPSDVNEIELIDEMLRRPDIRPDEMDRLLDRRAELTANEIKKLES